MKKLTFLLLTSATILYSCESKNKTSSSETTSQASEVSNTPDAQAVPSTPADNVVSANSNDIKPALNPPHGEPYHRCDIQVGAPLDSPAPVNVAPVAPQSAPANTFNTNPISPSLQNGAGVTAAPTGPKPAVNPPHGEPHHRCDLQVGAPLT